MGHIRLKFWIPGLVEDNSTLTLSFLPKCLKRRGFIWTEDFLRKQERNQPSIKTLRTSWLAFFSLPLAEGRHPLSPRPTAYEFFAPIVRKL
jgi:hypothetical protein